MILCEQDLKEFELALNLARQIASKLTDKDIELTVLDEEAMRALNLEQRGINKTTDVLSFPLLDPFESLEETVNLPSKALREDKSLHQNSQILEPFENLEETVNLDHKSLREDKSLSSQNPLKDKTLQAKDKQIKNKAMLDSLPQIPLGSIVINKDAVSKEAKRLGHSKEAEFALLFLHGVLHLLGFDHEKDQGQMRQMERELITEFKLPESLIIRNEP
ncbi:rRNA maturation RNase YbeY [Campylobacter troglodytis]|uniref:rRNA maturation RNase YbeY n=1 Tax=Campylobacter troglodytis TaxID=654363 RepID=UPI00115B6424|nr:rRNA maturation RNase YbeY [Campylobacter troglodytis]TQR60681.1 rRNA maturation RNase YbeY [Campylobacter troglodytis]